MRSAGQYFFLACRLAKAHRMFVSAKPHGGATDYLLFRATDHHRPVLVGKRRNAAALLKLVERAMTTVPSTFAALTEDRP